MSISNTISVLARKYPKYIQKWRFVTYLLNIISLHSSSCNSNARQTSSRSDTILLWAVSSIIVLREYCKNIFRLYYYQWTLNLEVSKNPDNRGMMKAF